MEFCLWSMEFHQQTSGNLMNSGDFRDSERINRGSQKKSGGKNERRSRVREEEERKKMVLHRRAVQGQGEQHTWGLLACRQVTSMGQNLRE